MGHGCYLATADYAAADASARHRLLVEATLPTMASDAVVSHISAAVLYELPIWSVATDVVHVTRDRRNGGRIAPALHVHCAPIGGEVAVLAGRLVTTPGRTVVDLARSLPLEPAVVLGDALIHLFEVGPDEVRMELERARYRRGISQARRAVAMLDSGSESVGESRSRVMFRAAGLPMPRSQVDIRDDSGGFVGRVDFYWEQHGVVGEFDGKLKYGGAAGSEALFAEKRREDAIRALGFGVVRWTWDELVTSGPAARLRRAFTAGPGPLPFARPAAEPVRRPVPRHPFPHTP